MDKVILRDLLFQKYFDVDNGIFVKDLNDMLSFIPDVWNKLHIMCQKNIKHLINTPDKYNVS